LTYASLLAAAALTVSIGLIPISYEPFAGRQTVVRLLFRIGLIALGALALGVVGELVWPRSTAAAVALGTLGIAIAIHHAVWAAASGAAMFLWPGVAAAGCGLLLGGVWYEQRVTLDELQLIGLAVTAAGMAATFFNLGRRR